MKGILPKEATAEVRQAAPEIQLALIFDEYDLARQQLREKKAELTAQLEGQRGYQKAAQEKSDAMAKIKILKEKVEKEKPELVAEIRDLKSAVKSYEGSMAESAAAIYRKTGIVRFQDKMGRQIEAEPKFSFVAASLEVEEADEEGEE